MNSLFRNPGSAPDMLTAFRLFLCTASFLISILLTCSIPVVSKYFQSDRHEIATAQWAVLYFLYQYARDNPLEYKYLTRSVSIMSKCQRAVRVDILVSNLISVDTIILLKSFLKSRSFELLTPVITIL